MRVQIAESAFFDERLLLCICPAGSYTHYRIGCDFLNDYEGIGGYEEFRDDLALMYLATLETSYGHLAHLAIVPFQIKRFRLNRAGHEDASWVRETLDRQGKMFGTRFTVGKDEIIELA